MHEASLAIWIMPAIAVAMGATLWAFGARLSRHAVMVTGFAAGVPAGAFAAQWFDMPWLPPVLGAILGAFAGLIIARIAYRLMLMATVGIAAALLGAVLSAAVVDSGAVAASGEQMSAAAKQRASELAETVAREMQSSNADQDTREAARDAVERFWNTLDAPERTLVIAATLACGLAGLAFGFFLKSLAEIAATAILGAFAGLIISRIAYRLMLMATVGIAAALLGAVLSAAVVDSGAVAASGEQMSAAAKQRASELAETVAREMQSSNADQDTREAARDAVTRFWNTLDAPERTLILAATIACGLAGLAFGFFLKSLAEIAATAILGSILIAWGLNEVLGPSGPRLATWSLATLVLAVAGMVVQTLTGARDAKPSAAKSATDAA